MHDEKKIEKIIIKNVHSNTKEINADIALQNLLFTKGITYTFKRLRVLNKDRNRIYLDKLLNLQNDFLWRYLENYTVSLKVSSNEYRHLNIIEVIDISIENIKDIINLNTNLDVLEIYGDEENFYHITRALFSLQKILDQLNLKDKFEVKFTDIIGIIFMKVSFEEINDSKIRFLYKILSGMMTHSLSSNEIWFAIILRDYCYLGNSLSGGTVEYMVFVSIYLFYLVNLETHVPNEFKKKIEIFINQQCKSSGFEGNTWTSVLNHKLKFLDIDEVTSLLQKLLFIYDCNSSSFLWYFPQNQGVYSTSTNRSFTRNLLMNWWIGYILTNENIMNYSLKTKELMPSLKDDDSYRLAVILNESWFEDDKLKIDSNLSMFEFYGEKNRLQSFSVNSELVSILKEFKNNRLKRQITKELHENKKTAGDLERFKTILANGIKEAIRDFPFLDKSLELEDEQPKFFGILFDTRWSEDFVKTYAKKMPESLKNLIYEDFKNNEEIIDLKKLVTRYDEDVLEKIIKFKPTSMNAFIYYDNTNDVKIKQLIDEINTIPKITKVWLPHDLFIKETAIRVNFEYIPNISFIRRLTTDEVNTIVDRDYKLVNGLYKYVEGPNGNSSVTLSRDEIIRLVSEKFFYACMVFKFKAEYHTENIMYFEKK